MSELSKKIEALLFYAAEPLSVKNLAELCAVSVHDIEAAVLEINESLAGHSLAVIQDGASFALVTSKEVSGVIEQLVRRDREAPLSPAAGEVLAIIAYTGGTTKHEIDFIRGVNSQYTLRALMMRGLIQKTGNESGSAKYSGTIELLSFLGVTSWEALPKHTELMGAYKNLIEGGKAAVSDVV